VSYTVRSTVMGYVCKDSPIKSLGLWRGRGEEAESQTDHPLDAPTEEPGTCREPSSGILTHEAAHDSAIPRRGRK